MDRVYWRLYAARRELEVRVNEHDLADAQLQRAQDAGQLRQARMLSTDYANARYAAPGSSPPSPGIKIPGVVPFASC